MPNPSEVTYLYLLFCLKKTHIFPCVPSGLDCKLALFIYMFIHFFSHDWYQVYSVLGVQRLGWTSSCVRILKRKTRPLWMQKSSFEILKDTAGFTSRIGTFGYSQKIISCKFCRTGKGLEIGCRLQRKRGPTIKCWLLYCSPKILGVQYRLGAPFLAVVESGIEVSLEFRNDGRYTSSWAPMALSSSPRTEAWNCWSWLTPLEVSFPNPVIVCDSSESD